MGNLTLSSKLLRNICKYMCIILLVGLLIVSVRIESSFEPYQILNSVSQGFFSSGTQEKTFNCSYIPQYTGTKAIFDHIYSITFKCENLVQVGEGFFNTISKLPVLASKTFLDGVKFMCMDKWLNLNYSDCLVYSFGIANNWKFDDDFGAFGCEVHSFDPTIKLQDHKRSPQVTFHNMGLAAHNGTVTIAKQACKVARLEDIIKMLGHEKRKIDYLKVDIEGSEVPSFIDIFEKNNITLTKYIMQIGMEIHLTNFASNIIDENIMKINWILLQKLSCFGFRLIHNEPNIIGLKLSYNNASIMCCYELVWVNTNFIQ